MWSFFSFSVCVVTAAQCGRRAGRLVIGRRHVRDHRCTASRRGVSARGDPNTSGTEALARAIGAVRSVRARVVQSTRPHPPPLHVSTHAPASRTRTPGRDPGRPRIDPDHDVPAVNNARQARHGPPLSPPAPPHGRTTRTCASAKCMRAVREAWIPLAAHPTQR